MNALWWLYKTDHGRCVISSSFHQFLSICKKSWSSSQEQLWWLELLHWRADHVLWLLLLIIANRSAPVFCLCAEESTYAESTGNEGSVCDSDSAFYKQIEGEFNTQKPSVPLNSSQFLSVPLSPASHVSSLLTHSQILSVTNLSASNLEYVVNIKETGTRNRLCSSLSHIVRIFKEMVDYLTYVVKPCVLVLTSPRRTPWNSLCHSPSTRLHF